MYIPCVRSAMETYPKWITFQSVEIRKMMDGILFVGYAKKNVLVL